MQRHQEHEGLCQQADGWVHAQDPVANRRLTCCIATHLSFLKTTVASATTIPSCSHNPHTRKADTVSWQSLAATAVEFLGLGIAVSSFDKEQRSSLVLHVLVAAFREKSHRMKDRCPAK